MSDIKVFSNISSIDDIQRIIKITNKNKFEYDWENNVFKSDIPDKLQFVIDNINDIIGLNVSNSFLLCTTYGQEYYHRVEDNIIRTIYSPVERWMNHWGGMLTFYNNNTNHKNIKYASNSNPIESFSWMSNSMVSFDSKYICHENVLSKYFPYIKVGIVIDFKKDE